MLEEKGQVMENGSAAEPQEQLPPWKRKPPLEPPVMRQPRITDVSWVKRKYLDVPYGEDSPHQVLDLYLPEEGGPFPLLIHIHGGAFAMGDKRDGHMKGYLTLLERGFAVASLEYRFSGEALFPAAVLDVRRAVRFLRARAAEYELDAGRFACTGSSAGGNLSAMLGMNVPNGAFPGERAEECGDAVPYVQAAVEQFGPMRFKSLDEQARSDGNCLWGHDDPQSPESKYLGFTLGEASEEQCAPSNPLTYAGADMAPLLVQHGTADHLMPYSQSVEFVTELRNRGLGDRVEFLPLEGADHEDRRFFTGENLDRVVDFLRRKLELD